MIEYKTPEQVQAMRRAGLVVAETLELLREAVRPGITTGELDAIAERHIRSRGATPNFLNYHGFPATICASVNDEIVHGIPGDRVLDEGDIVSIDCGAIVDGWHGDAAVTMGIGDISAEAQRLIDVTERSLFAGIDVMRDGTRLHEIGRAVQQVVEAAGYSVLRDYVGHGIGTAMHEAPNVP